MTSPKAVLPALRSTDWETVSDEEVVERVRGGEVYLYEILMRRYNQRLYRVARSILRDEAEAEDVMQDAYVRAYEHLDQFAGQAKFATWLTRIAVYEALARARRRGRTQGLEPVTEMRLHAMGPADPERQAYGREMSLLLEKAIHSLPEHYRCVFVLRAVEELSVAETASCLEAGEETVKTRFHRARLLLRKEIHRRLGSTAPDLFAFHLSRCDRVVEGVFRRIAAGR
ncbi:MAG: RNA polymerase sigma factor [Bryobacterales bacterium]|nr:RNA polymerase sigma factor [Bryobacterales bacterium]